MTTVLEPAAQPPVEPATGVADGTPPAGAPTPSATTPPAATAAPETPPVPPGLTILAVSLSAAAAAWMVGGIFRDALGRGVGLLGVAIAAGLLLLGARTSRPARFQYAILAVAPLVGGLLVLPDATGTNTIPTLIAAAIKNGGILQPPIPLDPGWRFLLVALFALTTGGAASLALALNRPRLGVLLPAPITVMSAVVQPDSAVIISAVGAMVLAAAAMGAAYGAELARSSGLSLQFERNRLMRGAAIVLVLGVAMGVVSRTGLLFPDTQRSFVSPPQKPQLPPPAVPHTLFEVTWTNKAQAPLRAGVLDVYDPAQQAWLLPSYDTSRLREIDPPSSLDAPRSGNAVVAEIQVEDTGGTHQLPVIPLAAAVGDGAGQVMLYDPQDTQQLQLRDRVPAPGFTYALSAPAAPTPAQLRAAGPVPQALKPFLAVPRAPTAIAQLLARAPTTSAFDRMQFLRQELYANITAKGTGEPVDITVDRVAQMLAGGTATPFELTAAEALLTRYAGIPSRIAFGYIGGHATDTTNRFAVQPDNGAAWLEAYFAGYGWVDIVGQPPKAQSSLAQHSSANPNIKASDKLDLVVYVPVRAHTALAIYQQVRYWVAIVLPSVLVAILALAAIPAGARLVRRRRRRRWAQRRGPLGEIGIAYAELRDAAADLGIGDRTATPLAFLPLVEDDAEHAELAWLVTRAVWGDLRRDLRPADARAAERMAASVARRIRRGQPMLTRVIALASRTSLRRPYLEEAPNAWFGRRAERPRFRRRVAARRWAPAIAVIAVMVIAAVAVQATVAAAATPVPSPSPSARVTTTPVQARLTDLVPSHIGGLTAHRETAAESAYTKAGADALVTTGVVFTLDQGPAVQASVQVSALVPGIAPDDHDLIEGLRQAIAGGGFQPLQVQVPLFDGRCRCAGWYHEVEADQLAAHGYVHIFLSTIPDQRVYFWIDTSQRALVILVVRSALGNAAGDALALSLVDFQRGEAVDSVPLPAAASASPSPGGSS